MATNVIYRIVNMNRQRASICLAANIARFSTSNLHFARKVLGIETSCDDTGAAIVDECGKILGDKLCSQQEFHIRNGGIIPPMAKILHEKNIENVVNTALLNAGCALNDLDAIATTVKPGLPMSLEVGLKYGKHLSKISGKPFIPIHHMEAHALTIRMVEKVEFPFLVLLISGGHCILTVARGVEDFLTLGNSMDDAPGEAFDKVARRLKLKDISQFSKMNGGQVIEILARKGDHKKFSFAIPLQKYRDCNFSFSGLKAAAEQMIQDEEKQHEVEPDGLIPSLNDFCASFQHAVTGHFVKRVLRAMVFCKYSQLIPTSNQCLVVSGGVACNGYVRAALKWLCEKNEYRFHCPPPVLCTDNGIMIAWNGIEKLRAGVGVAQDLDAVQFEGKCPLGVDISREVTISHLKVPPPSQLEDIFPDHIKHL